MECIKARTKGQGAEPRPSPEHTQDGNIDDRSQVSHGLKPPNGEFADAVEAVGRQTTTP